MLRLDDRRLLGALDELAEIGAIEGGGCARLALTDEDRLGRDLVVGWMKALGLDVRVDAIGNVIGLRAGRENLAPVMTGSHIDTVRTGGRYDGNYGVLAGLEVVRALNEAKIVDAPADRRRLLHQRGGRALPARHDGQPGLCRRRRPQRGLRRHRQGRRLGRR